FTLISTFTLFGTITGQADDVLPARFNFDRYSVMVNHSPFAIATAIALPSATPDFARDLYVANAARSPDGDLVTIASSSDQNFKSGAHAHAKSPTAASRTIDRDQPPIGPSRRPNHRPLSLVSDRVPRKTGRSR